MKKKKLSLKSSSGSGYNYEHIIQSELILDCFYANNYFNMGFLKSSNQDEFVFQARNLGYQIDDLIIKSNNKNYLFQITEETIAYSSGAGKFKEFIENAYTDYKKDNNIEIILVKSSTVVSKDKAVFDFLMQLKKTKYENFSKQKKSDKEKEFMLTISKILKNHSNQELYEFLKRIVIITKNNALEFNIDYSNIIRQNLKVKNNYELVVSSLKDFCFKKSIGGETINFSHINNLLSDLLRNNVNELSQLLNSSRNQIKNINDKINNQHIERDETFNLYIEKEKQINIIYGEPGVGKSAFIKTIYNSNKNQYKFFVDGEAFFKENTSLYPIKELSNVCNDILLIIDRIEKIFENNTFNFVQFLKEIKNINIILVTRKYSLDKVKEMLLEVGFDNNKNFFEISEITDEQLDSVLNSNSISITNKHLKHLLKNVFYLNTIINYSIILESEKEIINEYKIKEKIFNAITENNIKYKNAMISIFEKKHNINNDNYKHFLEEIEYLIDKNIVIDYFGNYSFSHDKYDDLVLFYILEKDYNNNLKKLLENYTHNSLMLRGINIWFKDKIINDKKEIMNQIYEVLKEQSILMLYKTEIIKILYEQKIITEFLDDENLEKLFDDIYLFNLIISSTLIIEPINVIADKEKRYIATFDFLTLDEYIIPNKMYLDILTKKISLKKDKIEYRHIDGIMRILKSICKYTKINNNLVYEMKDYYILFKTLIPFFEDYELDDLFRKEFLNVYYHLSTYDIEDAKNTLNNIVKSRGNRHKLNRLELYIMDSLVDLEKGSMITSLYAKNFYKQICYIILDLSLDDEEKRYTIYRENPYKIKDTHASFPSAISNQLYFTLKEKPKETFVIINDFLNRITKNYLDNENYEGFKFELNNKTIDLPLDINHYSGYRGFGNLPNLLKVVLMAIERFLLFDLKDKKKDFYLNELLTNCSSLMQISIVCSVIKSEPEQQFDLLITLVKNKYILSFDLNCTIHEMTSLFMYNDPFNALNQAERKKSAEIYNRKKSLWDILLDLQSNKNYNEKIWELFEELKPQLGNSEDDMIIKKRIHDFDLRNYVPVKEVERDGKNYIEFLPKENDDKEVKDFLKKRDNTEYNEHIILEQHIKKILDKEEQNDLTIQDLHKEYNKVNQHSELSLFDDYLLILVLNTKPQNFSEKLFKNKVKKIIISKLESEKTIGWERIYRNYLIQLVPNLYNHWTKNTICNFLIHCLMDSHSHEDYIKSICKFKENEPQIYKNLIKLIKNRKDKLSEADYFSLILKISNKDNFKDFENEINDAINYISIDDRTHQDYTLRHSLSNFLVSNINDKTIGNLISNIINSDKPNYELIEELINDSISLVDSKEITIENFWNFIESTASVTSQRLDNNSPEKYVSRSSSYIRNNYYYYENKIIRLILLDYPYWNQKTHKWQPLENNSIYIRISKMFAHLPVGLSAIMRTMWQFRDNLPPKTLLEFANIIEENSNVNDYFSDRDTQFILEFLITELYNKELETLNENELLKLSNIIMNFVLCTSSYRINYIYQQLLPNIYK